MTAATHTIDLQAIGKTYCQPNRVPVHAVSQLSLQIDPGEFVAIVGASGSGKSTLMNLMGLLDRPSEGSYRLDGQDVSGLTLDQQARLRNRRLGFIFQSFRLLPRATALENVELPLLYSDRPKDKTAARRALEAVGLSDRTHHAASELSGGQQQRVAIARALVNNPALVLADEPTGNLDQRAALDIMGLLQALNRAGKTIVLVTHDPELARHCHRIARLEDGRLVSDERVSSPRDARQPHGQTTNRALHGEPS